MKKILLFALCISLAAMSAGCGNKSSEDAATNSVAEFAAPADDIKPSDAGDSAPKGEAEMDIEAAYEAAADDGGFFEGIAEEAESSDFISMDAVAAEGETDKAFCEEPLPADPEPTEIVNDDDKFGLLTAGRWNDNSNWGFFSNIVDNDLVSFPAFGLDPCSRVAVSVKDGSGEAAVNSRVTLSDGSGSTVWSSVTDSEGKAYLFTCGNSGDMKVTAYGKDGSEHTADVNVEKTGDEQQGKVKKAASAEAEIVVNSSAPKYSDMQVMFIMDATGSMGDEMFFLQKDFAAIARECGTDNTEYSVNFYRDHGDKYVTKCFDFSKDISDIQKKINEQSADGGGDRPEAVAEILEETMNSSGWKEDSVKVAFLIFDAPPHNDKAEMIISAVKTASEKGIHLVPVVSSNAERDTELFGRAAAIMTNGEYVFLTDDSGIGDSHLEPIIGDYEVEKLYDIIVNIIAEYRQQ